MMINRYAAVAVLMTIALLCLGQVFYLSSRQHRLTASTRNRNGKDILSSRRPNERRKNNFLNNKTAFVCVTGQLSRLELHNKIERLFKPLNRLGMRFNILLVLQNTPPRYSNADNGEKMSLFNSFSVAMNLLKNVSGVDGVKHVLPDFSNLKINPKYRISLDNNKTADCAENNARQFYALQYCHKWPEGLKNASYIIRIREDVMIYDAYYRGVMGLVQNNTIVTTACDSWGGINDKVAIASTARAKDLFMQPYRRYTIFKRYHFAFNAERLYKMAYNRSKFDLKATGHLVVTKAITRRQSINSSNTCIVEGNPFQMVTTMCPPQDKNRSRPSATYTAPCFKY